MKRFLPFVISVVFIFSACSTVPVTRYSNAYKEPGFGLGIDVAIGRELSMGISSDRSTYEDDSLKYWYPLIGISGYFNFSRNLSFTAKTYTLPFGAIGIQTGMDFIPYKSEAFAIGSDLNFSYIYTSGSYTFMSSRTDFSYSAQGVLADVYFSKPLFKQKHFKLITNLGVKSMYSNLKVADSVHFNFFEAGGFVNLYTKLYFLHIVPEVALMVIQSPTNKHYLQFFPGIYIALGK